MIIPRIKAKYLEWQFYVSEDLQFDKELHIDLGSGKRIRNPFNCQKVLGSDYKLPLDGVDFKNFLICDLSSNIPLASDSVSSFSAFDVLEHIPRWDRNDSKVITFPFINFMNEVNRCLKPGGIFMAVTPAFPSPAAFQDPTHVNFITEDTVRYFTEDGWAKNLEYEFAGNFRLIKQSWVYSQNVFDGFQDKPNTSFRNFIFLIKNFFKIMFNLYLRRNKPTHLLWILQKN